MTEISWNFGPLYVERRLEIELGNSSDVMKGSGLLMGQGSVQSGHRLPQIDVRAWAERNRLAQAAMDGFSEVSQELGIGAGTWFNFYAQRVQDLLANIQAFCEAVQVAGLDLRLQQNAVSLGALQNSTQLGKVASARRAFRSDGKRTDLVKFIVSHKPAIGIMGNQKTFLPHWL